MISNETFLKEISSELERETEIQNCYNKYIILLPLEEIFTTESVYMAACHCASGFMGKNDTFQFMLAPLLNSYNLAQKVINGNFRPQYYPEKIITERGKPRVIKPPKFECKVVQKVLCDYILRAVLEPKMISTSYASIRGRAIQDMFQNILLAINKVSRCKDGYIVISDFKGYFSSINTNRICDIFRSWGMDERIVRLFHSFDPLGVGLSLGNETSQVPASWYASTVDHELKAHHRYKNVFRFMDDMLIVCDSKKDADKCEDIIRNTAEKIELIVKKVLIIPVGREFSFCKERFCINKDTGLYYRTQNPKNVSNEIRKIKAFEKKIENGDMTVDAAYQQANAVIQNIKTHPNNKKRVKRLEECLEKHILS